MAPCVRLVTGSTTLTEVVNDVDTTTVKVAPRKRPVMKRLATLPRQLLWFMLVGALSTVLQTLVYLAVRPAAPATWASWIALLAITPLNTEAHRRLTFAVKTRAVARLHGEAGLTSVAVYLANLAVAPLFAGLGGAHPSSLTEALILGLTGSLIGALRYLLLRGWVFAAHRHQPAPAAAPVPASAPAPADASSVAPAGPCGFGRRSPAPRHRIVPLGFRTLRDRGQRCPGAAGSRLRKARRSPAGRRSTTPDQRPTSTR